MASHSVVETGKAEEGGTKDTFVKLSDSFLDHSSFLQYDEKSEADENQNFEPNSSSLYPLEILLKENVNPETAKLPYLPDLGPETALKGQFKPESLSPTDKDKVPIRVEPFASDSSQISALKTDDGGSMWAMKSRPWETVYNHFDYPGTTSKSQSSCSISSSDLIREMNSYYEPLNRETLETSAFNDDFLDKGITTLRRLGIDNGNECPSSRHIGYSNSELMKLEPDELHIQMFNATDEIISKKKKRKNKNKSSSKKHLKLINKVCPLKGTRKRHRGSSYSSDDTPSKDSSITSEYIHDYSDQHKKYTTKVILPNLSNDRIKSILRNSEKKCMSIPDVQQVLWLFKLRNFEIKLKILSSIVGNQGLEKHHIFPPHQEDKGLIITERQDGRLNMTIKTYAGARDGQETFKDSIMLCFKWLKQFQIYFRQPNEPTTYKSKNNLLTLATKRMKLEKGCIPVKCVKRPLNSFMLYRAMMVKAIIFLSFLDSLSDFIFFHLKMTYDTYDVKKENEFLTKVQKDLTPEIQNELKTSFKIKKFNHHLLIQIVSLLWGSEDPGIKKKFYEVAAIEKEIHAKCYPEYKYRPNRKL